MIRRDLSVMTRKTGSKTESGAPTGIRTEYDPFNELDGDSETCLLSED